MYISSHLCSNADRMWGPFCNKISVGASTHLSVRYLSGLRMGLARSHDCANIPCALRCRVTAIAVGLNHTAALTVGGDLLMCGHNKHGALGLGDTWNRFLPQKVWLNAVKSAVCGDAPAAWPGADTFAIIFSYSDGVNKLNLS